MKDNPKSMSAEEYSKKYVTSKKPISQNITSKVFKGIFNNEKQVMTAEEWRNKMKKESKTKPSKQVNEIRIMLQLAKLPFVEEHKFHPTRRWRFDFAIPERMIAIEYEGIFSEKSGHTTHKGYIKDTEKYNEAAKLGWTVLRYTAKTYKEVIDDINELPPPYKPTDPAADWDDEIEDDDSWQPCDNCDLPDACADFGCAIKQGLREDPSI